jgi:hypothetical protein
MLSLSLSLSVPYSAAKLFPDRLLLLWLVLPQMSQSIALTATRTTLNNAEKLDSLGPAWHTIVVFCSGARGTLLIWAEFHFARAHPAKSGNMNEREGRFFYS